MMYGDVFEIQEQLKKEKENVTNSEEEDDDNDENLIDKDNLKSQLNSTEKERYKKIGEEFMKGAELPIKELQKSMQLKEKMRTSKFENKIKEEKKKQEKEKTKKKGSFFAKLAIILGTLGIAVALFGDKLKKMFPTVDVGFGDLLSSAKDNIFTKFSEMFYNIISVTFGGTIGEIIKKDLPNIVRSFFFTVLPSSIERSALAVMTAFSAEARKESDTLEVAADAGIEESKRKYDQERARQLAQEDALKLKSGAFSASELLAANARRGVTASINYDISKGLKGAESTQSMIAKIYGKSLFGDVSQDEAKAFIFNDNNPITRAMMTSISKNEETYKKLMEGGLTVDEIKKHVVPMLAEAAGISKDDARYDDFSNSVLSTFGNNANQAATRLNSLIGASKEFMDLSNAQSIAAQKAAYEASSAERTAARAKIQIGGMTPEALKVELGKAAVEDQIAAEVHTFYSNVVKLFDNPNDIANKFLESSKSIISSIFNSVVTNAFDTFDTILEAIPPLFKQYKGLSTFSKFDLTVNNATVTNENFNAALGGNDRPVVVVSISVGDTLIENFTQTTARRAQTLEKIEKTNDVIEKLTKVVKDKIAVENKGINMENIEKTFMRIIAEDNKVTEQKFNIIDDELTHIKNYLEANDVEGDTTRDFVLQAQS